MKLPRNYFENLTASKYREYLKLLPDMKKDNTRIITTLILTFTAMSFFGIFAINPTLSTIVDLRKQLTDSEFVAEQLETKIANLSTLQNKYTQLAPDIPVVLEAIPENPAATLLVGQVQTIARDNNITILSLRISEVQLTSNVQSPTKGSSFTFLIEAKGNYQSMIAFVDKLTRFNRIVVIDSLGINKDNKQNSLLLNVRGRAYFKNI